MGRILATIGHLDANHVTTPDLVEWHASLEYSPRAANICLTALSSILQRSVEWGLIESNPARGVKRRRELTATVQIPTHAEVARLGMTAPTDHARGLLLVACYAGVRQGELYALRVGDLFQGRLRVAGAIGPNRQPKTTKTMGERVVPLPASVYEWLSVYVDGRASAEYLFPHWDGGPLQKDVWRRSVWNPWTIEAGCEGLLWRHLRHYYASTIASVGASLLQCSRWMGHATITTTMDRYSFLFDHDEKRVMQALDSA